MGLRGDVGPVHHVDHDECLVVLCADWFQDRNQLPSFLRKAKKSEFLDKKVFENVFYRDEGVVQIGAGLGTFIELWILPGHRINSNCKLVT